MSLRLIRDVYDEAGTYGEAGALVGQLAWYIGTGKYIPEIYDCGQVLKGAPVDTKEEAGQQIVGMLSVAASRNLTLDIEDNLKAFNSDPVETK